MTQKHAATATELDFDIILLASGLGQIQSQNGLSAVTSPYLAERFGMAVVATSPALAPDKPLALCDGKTTWRSHRPAWWFGVGGGTPGWKLLASKERTLHMGSYPMEKKGVAETTTVIDGANVPRVPKRAEFFCPSCNARFGRTSPKGNGRSPLCWQTSVCECYAAAEGRHGSAPVRTGSRYHSRRY